MILNIFYIVAWGYILVYIVKLEKIGCPCAKDWRRDFIKYYIGIMLLLIILRMFDIYSPSLMPPILMTLQFILSIAFVMIVYHYIIELKKKKCDCSAHLARDILEIVNYIQIVLIAIMLFLMIHLIFTIEYFYNNNKSFQTAIKKITKKTPK